MGLNTGVPSDPSGVAYQYCSICGTELEVKVHRLNRYPAQEIVYLVCPSRRAFLSWIFTVGPHHDEIYVGIRPAKTAYDPFTGERNKK